MKGRALRKYIKYLRVNYLDDSEFAVSIWASGDSIVVAALIRRGRRFPRCRRIRPEYPLWLLHESPGFFASWPGDGASNLPANRFVKKYL